MNTQLSTRSRIFWLLSFCGSLLLAYVGIRFLSQNETLPAGVPAGYARRWLIAPVCAPPCWEGVTPGATTVRQALDILDQNPGIIAGSARATDGYVIWRWKGSAHGGEARYDPDDPQQRIVHIRPFYEYMPGAHGAFTLAEVMQRYGAPSHIRAYGFYGLHGDGPFYTIEIIYQSLG